MRARSATVFLGISFGILAAACDSSQVLRFTRPSAVTGLVGSPSPSERPLPLPGDTPAPNDPVRSSPWPEDDARLPRPDLLPTPAGSLTAPLILEGGEFRLDRQPATTVAEAAMAPRLASLVLEKAEAGRALTGTFSFQGQEQGDMELIVQIQGIPGHYRYVLPRESIRSGVVDLSMIQIPETFPEGDHLLSVALQDASGRVSTYLTVRLTVGSSKPIALDKASPIRVIGALPSQETAFFAAKNGTSEEYDGQTIVAEVELDVDLGSSRHLYLAGDASGSAVLGWDNNLVVEVREAGGGKLIDRWLYGTFPLESIVRTAEPPTVPGTLVGVPNPAPFGYEPKALDLLSQLQEPPARFQLRFLFLDYGVVGSTTDIWMLPEP